MACTWALELLPVWLLYYSNTQCPGCHHSTKRKCQEITISRKARKILGVRQIEAQKMSDLKSPTEQYRKLVTESTIGFAISSNYLHVSVREYFYPKQILQAKDCICPSSLVTPNKLRVTPAAFKELCWVTILQLRTEQGSERTRSNASDPVSSQWSSPFSASSS